jgi:predicted Zn-dependent protease
MAEPDAGSTIRKYIELTRLEPGDPVGWYKLGEAYLAKGSTLRARQPLERATTLRPQLREAWDALRTVYRDLGEHELATEAEARSRDLRGPSAFAPGLSRRVVHLVVRARHLTDAEGAPPTGSRPAAAAEQPRWAPGALPTESFEAIEPADRSAAIQHLWAAAKADPASSLVWYQLGVLYGETGQRNRVVQIHAQLQRLSKELADSLEQLWF